MSTAAYSQNPVDIVFAKRCFQEAKWQSDDDGGKLWGEPLYGPMLFVDPQTRHAIANQPDKEGHLKPQNGVWIGVVPKELAVANTAMEWSGVHWTMVMLPLPESTANRALLMMHECWHRIQDKIGLPPARTDNSHLDTKDGRVWLRMEYRALSLALISWGDERKQAISDALLFRAYRQSLFPNAKANEDRMEVHEGLAEYTGICLMGLGDFSRRSYLSGRIKLNAQKPTYPLSFAYETGPAYGLLLDMEGHEWRKQLTPKSSLSDLLRGFEGLALPSDLASQAQVRAKAYKGAEVFAEEEERDRKHREAVAKYRKLLIDGPVLALPMPHPNYTYDPNTAVPMGSDGMVFPITRISDDWGTLEVTDGARVNATYDVAFVGAPAGPDQRTGPGWKLSLKPGWKIVPGKRPGDFTVAKN